MSEGPSRVWLRELFVRMDVNGDDSVSRSEMRDFLSQSKGENQEAATLLKLPHRMATMAIHFEASFQKAFDKIDADKSDGVSWEELCAHFEVPHQGDDVCLAPAAGEPHSEEVMLPDPVPLPFLWELFVRMDKDGSGGINRAELIQALQGNPEIADMLKLPTKFRIGSKAHKKFENTFAAIDTHHNDVISWEELSAFFGLDPSGIEGIVQERPMVAVPSSRDGTEAAADSEAAPAAQPEVPTVEAAPAAQPEVPTVEAAPAAQPEVPPVEAAPAAQPEVPPVPVEDIPAKSPPGKKSVRLDIPAEELVEASQGEASQPAVEEPITNTSSSMATTKQLSHRDFAYPYGRPSTSASLQSLKTQGLSTWNFWEASGCKYEGEKQKGDQWGIGRWDDPDGALYEGSWVQGKRHGQGEQKWPDGRSYNGGWEINERHGQGVYKGLNKEVYDGQWEKHKRHGKGKQTYQSGNDYDGEWQNDLKHGWGCLQWSDGSSYEGEFCEDMMWGRGTMNDGKKSFIGEYYRGKFVRRLETLGHVGPNTQISDEEKAKAALKIQQMARKKKSRERVQRRRSSKKRQAELPTREWTTEEQAAAGRIQAGARGHKHRRSHAAGHPPYHTVIAYRGADGIQGTLTLKGDEMFAAGVFKLKIGAGKPRGGVWEKQGVEGEIALHTKQHGIGVVILLTGEGDGESTFRAGENNEAEWLK